MDKEAQSVLLAASVGALVIGVFQGVAPSMVDAAASPPDDGDLYTATKTAAWVSAGVVSGVSLLTKDPTVFVIGSAITVGYAWWLHAANHNSSGIGPVGKPVTIVADVERTDTAPVPAAPAMSDGWF